MNGEEVSESCRPSIAGVKEPQLNYCYLSVPHFETHLLAPHSSLIPPVCEAPPSRKENNWLLAILDLFQAGFDDV